MPPTLDLSPDELLSTTRAVRKRLDLARPVEDDVLRECIEMATQAPTGGNAQGWHFVVVTDAEKRAKLAELYRTGWETFYGSPEAAIANMPQDDPNYLATQRRVLDSAVDDSAVASAVDSAVGSDDSSAVGASVGAVVASAVGGVVASAVSAVASAVASAVPASSSSSSPHAAATRPNTTSVAGSSRR